MNDDNNNNNDDDDKIREEQDEREEKQLKDIFEQCDKLVELIKNYDGCKSDATFRCCLDLVIFGGESHFESLGILTELEHAYRDASIEVLREQEDDGERCDECGEYHEIEDEDSKRDNKKHLLN